MCDALDQSSIKHDVDDMLRKEPTPEDFDNWHRTMCTKLIQHFTPKVGSRSTYGRAAKMVAIYLKVTVIIGKDSSCTLAKIAHPPVDRILLNNVSKAIPKVKHLGNVTWTKLDEDQYFIIIDTLRDLVPEGEPFWKIEKFWKIGTLKTT